MHRRHHTSPLRHNRPGDPSARFRCGVFPSHDRLPFRIRLPSCPEGVVLRAGLPLRGGALLTQQASRRRRSLPHHVPGRQHHESPPVCGVELGIDSARPHRITRHPKTSARVGAMASAAVTHPEAQGRRLPLSHTSLRLARHEGPRQHRFLQRSRFLRNHSSTRHRSEARCEVQLQAFSRQLQQPRFVEPVGRLTARDVA